MSALVLDASVALGWMLDRPVLTRASHVRDLITSGETPVVPARWNHEVSNALVISERRGRLTAGQVKTLMESLEAFSQFVEVDTLPVPVAVLIETARRTHLTVYDAAYLELALRRKLPLATLDDKLRNAARRHGVEVI